MNMQAMLQQAKKMEKDISKKKDELNSMKFEGTSELVDVVVTGDKKVVSVSIKADIDNDDKEVLEDMVVIALNNAFEKIDKKADDLFGAYGNQFGGLF